MNVNKCIINFHVLPFPKKKEATVVFKNNKFY